MDEFAYTAGEILIYCAFAVLGNLAHIVKKLANKEATGDIINVKKWGKAHLFRNLAALLGSIGGIGLASVAGGLNIGIAILIGYTGDSLLANRSKDFKDEIKK